MISEFLAPVEENIVDFKKSLPERSIGKKINLYNKSFTNLTNIDIAVIGLNEYRGSDQPDTNYLKINYLRKEFYSLYSGDWNINLIDLGDVINGNKLSDTYYAVQIICEELINNEVIPFFIGSSQDLTFSITSKVFSAAVGPILSVQKVLLINVSWTLDITSLIPTTAVSAYPFPIVFPNIAKSGLTEYFLCIPP